MKRTVVLSVIAVVALAGSAMADLTPQGTPQVTGSWYQEFLLTDPGDTFDRVLIGEVGPASQRPWHVEVLTSGVTVPVSGGSSYLSQAEITGTDMTSLLFNMHFAGQPNDGARFLLSAYDKGKFLWSFDGAALAVLYGGQIKWQIAQVGVDLQAVPVPGAVLLGVLGLVAAGRKLRKIC